MYLTKITVAITDLQGHHLFDSYRCKQEIYKSFQAKNKRPFLFDIKEQKERVVILVLSYDAPKVGSFGVWETKQLPASFYDGGRYIFEVTANPTVKRVLHDERGNRKRQGKREGLLPSEYEKWIQKKMEGIGCSVSSLRIEGLGKRVCSHKGRLSTHDVARFSGILEVQDADKFRSLAPEGIGSAKSFGFGLLLLKKV